MRMYTVIVTPVHGEQVIRQFDWFSEAYAFFDQIMIVYFVDNNFKSVEMRYSDEKI